MTRKIKASRKVSTDELFIIPSGPVVGTMIGPLSRAEAICFVGEIVDLFELSAPQAPPAAQPDNGNTFIFCDYVEGFRACVRGAGHDGAHALCLAPLPQEPILLTGAPLTHWMPLPAPPVASNGENT